jgi:leucyl aminopeptidase
MLRSVTVRPDTAPVKEDVVILPVAGKTGRLQGTARALDRACKSFLSHHIKKNKFGVNGGDTLLVSAGFPKQPSFVLLLGLGARGDLTPESIAEAAGAAAKTLSGKNFKSAALLAGEAETGDDREGFVRAFIKGFSLAQYGFSLNEKPAKPPTLRRLVILSAGDRASLKKAANDALVTGSFTAGARDMVNTPANMLTPSVLADRAKDIARENGLSCTVLGPSQLKRKKIGAVLAVARGSREEPRLIVLEYNRDKNELPHVCLVGKGVTFDSGGISLKHWEKMHEMKGDMAGAAVAINSIAAASRLGIPVRVTAVVPAVENMPDGSALKPGDVVTAYSGKTIEILSTDAEGRLILADALTYVRKHIGPDVTIDVATLTGAVLIALGTRIAGLIGNNQEHVDRLVAAGDRTGEPAWQLPLDAHFRKSVKGTITDYKNYSGRNGSTITAAALLAEFAGDDPWVHMDIAGTFWTDGGGASYHGKGATGYGVDLLVEYLRSLSS